MLPVVSAASHLSTVVAAEKDDSVSVHVRPCFQCGRNVSDPFIHAPGVRVRVWGVVQAGRQAVRQKKRKDRKKEKHSGRQASSQTEKKKDRKKERETFKQLTQPWQQRLVCPRSPLPCCH
jgi:hypothetical protein